MVNNIKIKISSKFMIASLALGVLSPSTLVHSTPYNYFEAGSHNAQNGNVNNCIMRDRGASRDTATIFGAECPTSSEDGSNVESDFVPSRADLVPCTPDRTVLAEDELALTQDLGLQALHEVPSNRERETIQNEINRRQDFPMRDLMSVEDGGIDNGGRVEIRELEDGRIVYETHKGDLPWEGFANDIIGKVGLTSTFFEGNGVHQFNVKAFESHRGKSDPIVFPCQRNIGHEHTFFGNATVNGHSTTSTMFGATTTANPIAQLGNEYIGDFSAYWVPTLIVGNTRPKMIQNSIYYSNPAGNYHLKNGRNDFTRPPIEQVQPFPLGLRMIAGTANGNTRNTISNKTHWTISCPNQPLITIRRGTNIQSFSDRSIRNCTVRMFIRFPGWWDGQHLSKPDNSHMSYTKTATHTIPVPSITYVIPYKIKSNHKIADIRLASGSIWSLHGDFWNVWDPTMLEFLVNRTINRGENWQEWIAITTETSFTKNDIQARNDYDLGAVPTVRQCSAPLGTNRATYRFDVNGNGPLNAWFRVRRQGGAVDPGTVLLQVDGIRVNNGSGICGIPVTSEGEIDGEWTWVAASSPLDFTSVRGPHDLHLSSNVGRLEIDQFLLTSTDCNPNDGSCPGANLEQGPVLDVPEDDDDHHHHPDDPDRRNIIPFGQFESNTPVIKSAWFACSSATPGCRANDFPNGVRFDVENESGLNSTRALRIKSIQRPNSERNFWTLKNNSAPSAEENKEYIASISVKTANARLPEISLLFLNERNKLIDRFDSFPGSRRVTEDWQKIDVVGLAPQGATKVRVEIGLLGSGTVWLDDAFVAINGSGSHDHSDNDPVIVVCRNGEEVSVVQSERTPVDTDLPCLDPNDETPENDSGNTKKGNLIRFPKLDVSPQLIRSVWFSCSTGVKNCSRSNSLKGVRFRIKDGAGIKGSQALEIISKARPKRERNYWAIKNSEAAVAEAGVEYSASAFTKVKHSKMPQISLVFLDNRNKPIKRFQNNPVSHLSTTDWKRIKVKGVAPKGTAKVRLEIGLVGEGTAWFDNVSVVGNL